MKTIPEPSRINLNFHPRAVNARAVMVVDEDLSALIPLLEDLRFRTFSLMPGMTADRMDDPSMLDSEMAHLLYNRVVVTRRAGDFRYAADLHEFSIIDVAECLQDDLASVALEISQHWNQLKLRCKQPFNLRLKPDGVPVITHL